MKKNNKKATNEVAPLIKFDLHLDGGKKETSIVPMVGDYMNEIYKTNKPAYNYIKKSILKTIKDLDKMLDKHNKNEEK